MEKRRQLDLSAPLLSVRRYSSPLLSSELTKPSKKEQFPALNKPCDDEEVTKPASVPFRWEQIPGRPKHSSGPTKFNSGSQNPPPHGPRIDPVSYMEHVILVEKLKESLRCDDDDDSESDDEGDALLSDALDELSCGESQSLMNCSVASGCHGSSVGRKKRTGKFSVDEEMRELMMSRFLPAAKAAALETPIQYDTKAEKEPSLAEKPAKKVVSGKIEKPLSSRYGSETYHHSRRNIRNEGGEYDECKELPAPDKKPSKRWGIIPRFWPGLRSSKSQKPQTLTARNALSGPLDKMASPLPHKKKFHSGEISSMESKLSKETDQFSKSRDSSSSAASSSSLRRYRTGNLSPNRNRVTKLPLPEKVDGYYNDGKLAASRKLFKALADVSMNKKTEEKSTHFLPVSNSFLPKSGKTETSEVDPICSEIRRVIKEERRSESHEIVVKPTLAPLIPKSPSESWLWRAGNPCVHSSRKSPVRTKEPYSKWETIVKSSNLRRERAHDSQELTPRPPSQRPANRSEISSIKN